VQVSSLNQRQYVSKIEIISPTIDPASGNLRVRVRLDNHDGRLIPGMFVETEVLTGPASAQLQLPATVFRNRDVQQTPLFIVRHQRALRLDQDLLRQEGNWVYLSADIKPDTLFILDPPPQLQEGMELDYVLN
jgi:multidrug efflux pump subunit AcrA (membrane-fusion protein)